MTITQISISIPTIDSIGSPTGKGAQPGHSSFIGKAFDTFLGGVRFGEVLAKKLPAAPTHDPLAAISALLNQGVPPSAILARAAKLLGLSTAALQAALQSALASQLSQGEATGPPIPIARPPTVAQSLLDRLAAMLATQSGENRANGQTNEISGRNLDAEQTAKALPAQIETTTSAQSAPSVSLRSLVEALIASFPAGSLPPQILPEARNLSLPAQIAPEARLSLGTLPSPALGAPTTLVPTPAPTPTPATAPLPAAFTPPGPAPAPAPAPASAPALDSVALAVTTTLSAPAGNVLPPSDLLGRMVARAVASDAALQSAAMSSTPSTQGQASPSGSVISPSMARIEALAAAFAASGDSNFESSGGFGSPTHDASGGHTPSPSSGANVATLGVLGSTSLGSTSPTPTASLAPLPTFASTLASSVDSQHLIEQVLKGMVVHQGESSSQMRLRLVPEHLGELAIKLTLQGSTVNASVVAQNADVRTTLLANQHHLSRAFAQSGLKLESFTVDLQGGNSGKESPEHDRTRGFGRRFIIHEFPASPDDGALAAVPSYGPPLLVASPSGLLNYLA